MFKTLEDVRCRIFLSQKINIFLLECFDIPVLWFLYPDGYTEITSAPKVSCQYRITTHRVEISSQDCI